MTAWNEVLESLDQEGAAVNLTSVDFAKAFNTMCHRECIRSLRQSNTSIQTTRMIAAFLMERKMRIKMNPVTFSELWQIYGGSPQGTLLGNFLFILTTDKLELHQRDRESSTDDSFVTCNESGTQHVTQPSPTPDIIPEPYRTSSPTSRGQVIPFDPPTSSDSDTDEDMTMNFKYLRQHTRRPYNRIDDTGQQSPASDNTPTDSMMKEQHPPPHHWRERP